MSNPFPLDYASPSPRKNRRRVVLLVMLIVAGVLALLAGLCGVVMNRGMMVAYRGNCASNLRQVGQAIFLYASANGGVLPPDLQTVVATQQIDPAVFICPNSNDTSATGANQAAILRNFGTPGHCSYIYVGAGLTTKSDPECIVAFEDPANESLDGANVLFAEGHVEFIQLPLLMHWLSDLQAGRNPPSSVTTLTVAQAKQDYQKNWKSRMPQFKTGVWRVPVPTTQAATAPAR